MDSRTLDTALSEKPSQLVERLKSQMLQGLNASQNHSSQTIMHNGSVVTGPDQHEFMFRSSGINAGMRIMPDIPNMGALVHTDIHTRMHRTRLEKFVNYDSLIYPFEVNVTLGLPKPNDFMWDFKHNFYLSIMYSQVYRYFFPFNRHNSQLFFITNENQPDERLRCMNIPSRTMFRSMNIEIPMENICIAAISAYKDYLAFFRLNSKKQPCPDAYKNFSYVPPLWANKLD